MGYHVGAIRDSLVNLMAGFGVPGRDKAATRHLVLPVQPAHPVRAGERLPRQLDGPQADRHPGAGCHPRVACVAGRHQRRSRSWRRRRRASTCRWCLKNAMIMARLYGGAAIILGVKGGTATTRRSNYERWARATLSSSPPVSRWALGHGPIIKDVMDPLYGKPEYFTRNMDVGQNRRPPSSRYTRRA